MDYKVFLSGLTVLQGAIGCDMSEEYPEIVYGIIKDDFTDNEFQCAVREILRQEELYGKMPTPKQFLKYVAVSQEELENYQKMEFLGKVADYLNSDYIPTEEKEEFIENLNGVESYALQLMGGISELWSRVHDDDYPVAVAKITKELGKLWEENYSAEKVQQRLEARTGGQESLGGIAEKLLQNLQNKD